MAAFASADQDNDGLLTLEEYKPFYIALVDRAEARNNWVDRSDAAVEREFNCMNLVKPEEAGVSKLAFITGIRIMIGKVMELKAAAGI